MMMKLCIKRGSGGVVGLNLYTNQDNKLDAKDINDDDILYKDREVGAWWLLPSLSNLMSTPTYSYPQHH